MKRTILMRPLNNSVISSVSEKSRHGVPIHIASLDPSTSLGMTQGRYLFNTLILIVGASLLLAACSHTPTAADIDKQNAAIQEAQQSESSVVTDESAERASIEIANFAFSPKTITVKPGTVIKVTNRDVAGHTMTSDDGNSFNTPLIGKDQSVEVTAPTAPGTYGFHCTPHPNMKGTLVVGGQ